MKNKHPRLWRFVKKLNRGLVLGLAIIIVLAIWLIASESKLRKETPELRAMTREYLTELIEVSSLSEGDEIGKKIPAETQKEMEKALSEISEKYYSNSKAAQRAYKEDNNSMSGAQLVEKFSSWAKESGTVYVRSVEITEKETELNNGNIFRNYSFEPMLVAGTYAEVYFNFEADVVYDAESFSDFPVYPFGYTSSYNDVYYDSYDKPIVDGEVYEKGAYTATGSVTISGKIIFVRENGEWKIACTRDLRAFPSSQITYEPLGKEVG